MAIELLAAAQGIDLRAPLATSKALLKAMTVVRGVAAFLDQDRPMAPDIEAVHGLLQGGAFFKLAWPEDYEVLSGIRASGIPD